MFPRVSKIVLSDIPKPGTVWIHYCGVLWKLCASNQTYPLVSAYTTCPLRHPSMWLDQFSMGFKPVVLKSVGSMTSHPLFREVFTIHWPHPHHHYHSLSPNQIFSCLWILLFELVQFTFSITGCSLWTVDSLSLTFSFPLPLSFSRALHFETGHHLHTLALLVWNPCPCRLPRTAAGE